MVRGPTEEDVSTFEGWLLYTQGREADKLPVDELVMWRGIYDKSRAEVAAAGPLGILKLIRPGNLLYAVAIQDVARLWLTFWVQRSSKGEIFAFYPRHAGQPHASYHHDGRMHHKSHGHITMGRQLQKPDGSFTGTETMGLFGGHGGRTLGAICVPSMFTGTLIVPTGYLGVRGAVGIDLVQPGFPPPKYEYRQVIEQRVFQEKVPHLVITVVV